MRKLGRGLQLFALVLLLVGLFFGLERGPNSMSLELGCLGVGACLFLLGLRLQKRAGS